MRDDSLCPAADRSPTSTGWRSGKPARETRGRSSVQTRLRVRAENRTWRPAPEKIVDLRVVMDSDVPGVINRFPRTPGTDPANWLGRPRRRYPDVRSRTELHRVHRPTFRSPRRDIMSRGFESRLLLAVPAGVHVTPSTSAAPAGVEEHRSTGRRGAKRQPAVSLSGNDADGVDGDDAESVTHSRRRIQLPLALPAGRQNGRSPPRAAAVVDDTDRRSRQRLSAGDGGRCCVDGLPQFHSARPVGSGAGLDRKATDHQPIHESVGRRDAFERVTAALRESCREARREFCAQAEVRKSGAHRTSIAGSHRSQSMVELS
ncbi:hypothetical protein SAMN04488554_3966 [Ruania alba]|uniref:Uncharacterized protein n=1 Tax=Ruania alba TaxID=648782 RepID=A0A1H5N5P9_9MICO|nr:hypothetical protein SAMN04488554_3966 [Ruania alba]